MDTRCHIVHMHLLWMERIPSTEGDQPVLQHLKLTCTSGLEKQEQLEVSIMTLPQTDTHLCQLFLELLLLG